MTIYEGINELRCIIANTTFNLCCDGLKKIREVERLELTLAEDEVVYRGSVRFVGPSTSVSNPSMSWSDVGVGPYMDVIDLSSSWTNCVGGAGPSTSILDPSTRRGDIGPDIYSDVAHKSSS